MLTQLTERLNKFNKLRSANKLSTIQLLELHGLCKVAWLQLPTMQAHALRLQFPARMCQLSRLNLLCLYKMFVKLRHQVQRKVPQLETRRTSRQLLKALSKHTKMSPSDSQRIVNNIIQLDITSCAILALQMWRSISTQSSLQGQEELGLSNSYSRSYQHIH